jgi:hypothetical protein
MDAQTPGSPVKRSRGRPNGSKSRQVFARPGARRDLVPIDKTSGAARFFDKMVRDIEIDLGGRRELTRIEGELIRGFAGAATTLRYLNHQVALGDISEIDLTGYATMASTMLRIGSRLGLSRRAKDISATPPTAEEYFAFKQKLKEAEANGAPPPDEVCT